MESKDNPILNLTIEFSIAVISFVEQLEEKLQIIIKILSKIIASTKNNLKNKTTISV
jgi:hypothetical protein